MLREVSLTRKGTGPDQIMACWSIWEEHRFSHDTVPDLSPDVIQKLGFLGLHED